MADNEVKINLTAETKEAEAAFERLAAKAQSVTGSLLSTRVLVIACAALFFIVLLGAIAGAVLYAREHAAMQGAQAFADARQAVIDAAEKRQAARDAEWKAEQDAYRKERAQLVTAVQAQKVMERTAPQTAGQIAQAQPAQIAPEVRAKLPDSPSYTVMTEQAAVTLGKAQLDGEQCKRDLVKCSADLKDSAEKLQATTQQRDRWKQTAAGGTKTRRIVRGAMVAGCGAAGAAVGSAANGSKGAAIGSFVSAAACAIFTR